MDDLSINLGGHPAREDEHRHEPDELAGATPPRVRFPEGWNVSKLTAFYPAWALLYLVRVCTPQVSHYHGGKACTRQRGKVPTPGWPDAALRSDSELLAFFAKIDSDLESGHNLALRVPDGAIVLDADSTGAAIELSRAVDDGVCVQITPKGLHSIHRYNNEVASTARLQTRDGVEFDIRAAGSGCLTLTPSIGRSGAPYSWVRNGEDLRELLRQRGEVIDEAIVGASLAEQDALLLAGYEAIRDRLQDLQVLQLAGSIADQIECLPAVPETYEEAIEGRRLSGLAIAQRLENDVERPSHAKAPCRADDYWVVPPEKRDPILEGNRNDRIYKHLSGLRGQGAPDQVIEEAADRLAANCSPIYPVEETAQIVSQVLKIAPGSLFSDRELMDVGFRRDRSRGERGIVELSAREKAEWQVRSSRSGEESKDQVRRAREAANRAARRRKLDDAFELRGLSMEALLEREAAEYEFLVEGLILAGAHTLLAAWPGVGKSYLTVDLAVCGAIGLDWCGGAVARPFSTLFIPYEDDRDEFRRRIEWQADARLGEGGFIRNRDTLGRRLRVVDKSALYGRPFDDAMAELVGRALEADPEIRLVVLDPAGKAVSGGGTSDIEDVQRYAGEVAGLCADHGVAVMSVNHITKASHQAGEDLSSHASTGRAEMVGDVRAQFQLAAAKRSEVEACFPHEPSGTRAIKIQLVKANYAAVWEDPKFFLRGERGTLLEHDPEMTKEQVQEAMLVRKIRELGMYANAQVLRELASEGGFEEGWPPINSIAPTLKRAIKPRTRVVDGVDTVEAPRLSAIEHTTEDRKRVRKQARKTKFYAPEPKPEGWPDGSDDRHFLEEREVAVDSAKKDGD